MATKWAVKTQQWTPDWSEVALISTVALPIRPSTHPTIFPIHPGIMHDWFIVATPVRNPSSY